MSTVYTNGMEDLSGQLLGTLRVGSIASRSGGVVRWNVRCERCGSQTTEPHQRLQSGWSCRNAACGREEISDLTTETLSKYRRRNEAAEVAKSEKLQREVSANAGKVIAVVRERILHGKDDEIYVSPELRSATMTQAQADVYNSQQAAIFVRDTPEWIERFACPENLNILGSYFDRNGIAITDYLTILAAFQRLRDCGALREKEPLSTAEPQQKPVIAEPESQPSEEPTERTDGQRGWNLDTGEERLYSNREIDRMSGEEYRRVFRLTRDKLIPARRIW